MTRVVGLDLSLTATGFADERKAWVVKPTVRDVRRLAVLREHVLHSTHHDYADLVVIEGYSMGTARQQSHAHGLGELGGVVRLALWEEEIAYVDIAPASLKKFATDKGNANKTAMATAASRCGYDGPDDDNAIDAWWLRQMGLYVTTGADVAETAYRAEVVKKIEWPIGLEAAAS